MLGKDQMPAVLSGSGLSYTVTSLCFLAQQVLNPFSHHVGTFVNCCHKSGLVMKQPRDPLLWNSDSFVVEFVSR